MNVLWTMHHRHLLQPETLLRCHRQSEDYSFQVPCSTLRPLRISCPIPPFQVPMSPVALLSKLGGQSPVDRGFHLVEMASQPSRQVGECHQTLQACHTGLLGEIL